MANGSADSGTGKRNETDTVQHPDSTALSGSSMHIPGSADTFITGESDSEDLVFARNYNAAAGYFRRHGNLEVKSDYVDADGIRLGAWLNYLRARYRRYGRSILTAPQFEMLERIGMRWGSKYDLQWNAAYAELCTYRQQHGNVKVPVAYQAESGFKLGRWIRRQQELYGSGALSAARAEKLRSLGVEMDPDDPWEEHFRLAKAYSEAHGDLNVPADDADADSIRLHRWLHEQRLIGEGKRKKQLTPDQRRRLESIGFVFGQTQLEQAWQKHFEAVRQYISDTGSAVIPKGLTDSDGTNLNAWVKRQLRLARLGRLGKKKTEQLRTAGLLSDSGGQNWETGYLHAKAYFEKHHDLLVKSDYCCPDGFHLYSWIAVQRANQKRLSANRKMRLEKIGMIWNVYAYRWQQMYESAVKFFRANGHMRVPVRYLDANGRDLYDWLQRQRKRRKAGKLPGEQLRMLCEIGVCT